MSGLDALTWTCMVCGCERADADIAVEKREFEAGSARGSVHVRYCRDRDRCRSGASMRADEQLASIKEHARAAQRRAGL